MPGLDSYALLAKTAMQIMAKGDFFANAILFFLGGWAVMQVIAFTTFVGWMIIFEGVTFGLLFVLLIDLIDLMEGWLQIILIRVSRQLKCRG